MLAITRWAGRHRILVRYVLVPILFYVYCSLAFVLGAEWFFDRGTLPPAWAVFSFALLLLATYRYPDQPREVILRNYWRVKGWQALAILAGFGLWMDVGNRAAAYFEPKSDFQSVAPPAYEAGLFTSEPSSLLERTPLTPARKLVREYYRGVIKQLKQNHRERSRAQPAGRTIGQILGTLLGALVVFLGLMVFMCGIACGGSAGGVALGVISGLGLIGLGISFIIRIFRNRPAPASPN